MKWHLWVARWAWFKSQLAAWLTLFGVIGVLVWVCFPHEEKFIRWTGLALQCIGMAVLIYGVEKAFVESGREGVLQTIRAYIAKWPRTVVSEVSVNITLEGDSVNGSFMSAPFDAPSALTLEAISAAMRQNHERAYTEITRRDIQIEQNRRDLDRRIDREVATVRAALVATRDESARATAITGALTLIGTICLIVGSVLGSLSNEISKFTS